MCTTTGVPVVDRADPPVEVEDVRRRAVRPDRRRRRRGPGRARPGRSPARRRTLARWSRDHLGRGRRRPTRSRTARRGRAAPGRPRRWRRCPPAYSVVPVGRVHDVDQRLTHHQRRSPWHVSCRRGRPPARLDLRGPSLRAAPGPGRHARRLRRPARRHPPPDRPRARRQLGLAVNTVAKAYRALETDGVITTEGRRGTFISGASANARDAADAYVATARRLDLTLREAVRLVEQSWPGEVRRLRGRCRRWRDRRPAAPRRPRRHARRPRRAPRPDPRGRAGPRHRRGPARRPRPGRRHRRRGRPGPTTPSSCSP